MGSFVTSDVHCDGGYTKAEFKRFTGRWTRIDLLACFQHFTHKPMRRDSFLTGFRLYSFARKGREVSALHCVAHGACIGFELPLGRSVYAQISNTWPRMWPRNSMQVRLSPCRWPHLGHKPRSCNTLARFWARSQAIEKRTWRSIAEGCGWLATQAAASSSLASLPGSRRVTACAPVGVLWPFHRGRL